MLRVLGRGARTAAISLAVGLVAAALVVAGCGPERDVAAEHEAAADRAAASERGAAADGRREPATEQDSVSRAPDARGTSFRAPDPAEPRPSSGDSADPSSLRARLRIPTEASARAWLQRFGEVVEERRARGE